MKIILLAVLSFVSLSAYADANIDNLEQSYRKINNQINILTPNINKDYAYYEIDTSSCNKSVTDISGNLIENVCDFSSKFVSNVELVNQNLKFHLTKKLKNRSSLVLSEQSMLSDWDEKSFSIKCLNIETSNICSGAFIIWGDLNYRVHDSKELQSQIHAFEIVVKDITLPLISESYYEKEESFLAESNEKLIKSLDPKIDELDSNIKEVDEESINLTNASIAIVQSNAIVAQENIKEIHTNSSAELSNTYSNALGSIDNLATLAEDLSKEKNADYLAKKQSDLANYQYEELPPSNCLEGQFIDEWDGEKWTCKYSYAASGNVFFKKSRGGETQFFHLNNKGGRWLYTGKYKVSFVKPIYHSYVIIMVPLKVNNPLVDINRVSCYARSIDMGGFILEGRHKGYATDDVACGFYVIGDIKE
tara:strand:- start:101 stop:1360 length:1260 start_codon:yes stop_codon:yes gene_type:complete